jgi:hypothetical protein
MSDLPATVKQLRAAIWEASGQNRIYIVYAQQHIGWDHKATDHSPYKWNELLGEVKRIRSTRITSIAEDMAQAHTEKLEAAYVPPPEVQHGWKKRYQELHEINFKQQYPGAYASGHYCQPTYPKINTSNGLTTYIINFILWSGYRATRINVSGRLIEAPQKQPSGVILTTKKYMHSATRKGSADISSTIKGRSFMWEIKIGADKPRPDQLKEQERERRAGGEYLFIKTVHEFLTVWDGIMYG